MNYDFSDKVVAITGPTGKSLAIAIAQVFYDCGARLAICSRSIDRVNETKRNIGGENCDDRILAVQMDAADPEQCIHFIDAAVAHFGKIDILINSAAVQYADTALEITPETWNHTFDVKNRGYFFCAQTAAKDMIRRNAPGCIINIGSTQSNVQVDMRLSYSAANAAIDQWTRSAAREWGPYGIRVNCVQVGSFPSALGKARGYSHDNLVQKLPLRRRGIPEEIGKLCMFLASEDAAYITGAKIPIDGGLLLVSM